MIVALAGERLYTAGQRAAHERRNGGGPDAKAGF